MKIICGTSLIFGLCTFCSFHANAAKPLINIIDKPGLFKLDQSTDSSVCLPLGITINADIQKYGKTQFVKHDEFVKWRIAEEPIIDRGHEQKYDGLVELTRVDIDNDGVVDRVVRTKWSMRGVLEDALSIFPKSDMQRIVIENLIKSEKKIMFNVDYYWSDRRIRKYGAGNYDWEFGGIAALNLLRRNGVTYVVAENYASPKNVSSKIYVTRFDANDEPADICMFSKICPCGGCEDLRGDEIVKTLPAKKWCGN
jgi:hypothetical protein